MSQVLEDLGQEVGVDPTVSESQTRGAPSGRPITRPTHFSSSPVGFRGFPNEDVIVVVSVNDTRKAGAKTAAFYDASGEQPVESDDTVVIHLSHERLVRCSRKSGIKHFHGLSVDREVPIGDEVLCDLAMCLNFNGKNPKGSNSHFAEQIISAIAAHVIQKYGKERPGGGRAANQLSPWQLRIAKQMLCGDMRSTPNLADVAEACRISTRHFTRSFTETIGTSPHQWSVLARLEHAKTILEDRMATLAETAVTCGFSDQSHFTRVFTREFGTSPARWRRSLDNNQLNLATSNFNND